MRSVSNYHSLRGLHAVDTRARRRSCVSTLPRAEAASFLFALSFSLQNLVQFHRDGCDFSSAFLFSLRQFIATSFGLPKSHRSSSIPHLLRNALFCDPNYSPWRPRDRRATRPSIEHWTNVAGPRRPRGHIPITRSRCVSISQLYTSKADIPRDSPIRIELPKRSLSSYPRLRQRASICAIPRKSPTSIDRIESEPSQTRHFWPSGAELPE